MILVDRPSLDAPIPGADERLLRIVENHIAGSIAAQPQENELVREVRSAIARSLSDGDVSIAAIARVLGVSQRTLQRRLSTHGIVYRNLVDEIRHDLAIRYLRDDEHSLTETAYLLGYWDGIDTDAQARTLVEIAVLEAMTGSQALRTAYDEHYRLVGNDGLLAWLLTDDGDALAALRARPELAEAVALRRSLPAERLRAFDWLLGLVTEDTELSATGRAAMALPHMRTGYELGAVLRPGTKRTELILGLLDAQ